MPGRCHPCSYLASLCALCLLVLLPVGVARACSLDGIVSLSVNGNVAGLTGGAPSRSNGAYWAPFTLISAAPGDLLRVQEDLGKVRRSLPADAFRQPFRWSFGDGSVVRGFSAEHRYRRLGWYKVTAEYSWQAGHRWVAFDSAQIRIVAAGDLWKANLGYTIGKGFQTVVRVLSWTVLAVLVGWAGWMWWPARKKRAGTHAAERAE